MPGHDPAEKIAPELVGSHGVRKRRRQQLRAGDVLGVGTVWSEHLAEDGEHEEENHDDQADEIELVADEESPEIPAKLALAGRGAGEGRDRGGRDLARMRQRRGLGG